ncbi:hypothetical protein [Streptomyces sp. bgisy153]|uniref:hypothetical protein n=1 Tax=Streptomyces sp. bgisy153 TaxID=3413793 RepID=UPI003D725EC1
MRDPQPATRTPKAPTEQEWADTWAAARRLQLAQCRRLQELMEDGIAAGLPVIEWTVQGLGALLGRPHHPDHRERRAEFEAWEAHLRAERLPETSLGPGRVRLHSVANPEGRDIPDVALLAEIQEPVGPPFPGDQVMRMRFEDVHRMLDRTPMDTPPPAIDPRVLGGGQPVRRRDIQERLKTLRSDNGTDTEGTDAS